MIFIAELLAIILILTGTAFSILGVVGFKRFPDVYTRLHTTGKVGIFGIVLTLIAAALLLPAAATRIIVLIGLLLVVGPVTAHALASAAYRAGIPMRNPLRNDLPDL